MGPRPTFSKLAEEGPNFLKVTFGQAGAWRPELGRQLSKLNFQSPSFQKVGARGPQLAKSYFFNFLLTFGSTCRLQWVLRGLNWSNHTYLHGKIHQMRPDPSLTFCMVNKSSVGIWKASPDACKIGLRVRNSPTCTLSQNGYGVRRRPSVLENADRQGR